MRHGTEREPARSVTARVVVVTSAVVLSVGAVVVWLIQGSEVPDRRAPARKPIADAPDLGPPPDNKDAAPPGFQVYRPEHQGAADSGPDPAKAELEKVLHLERVTLLTTQEETDRRIKVKTLADYIKRIHATVARCLPGGAKAGLLSVDITLAPDAKVTAQLGSEPEMNRDLLQSIYDALTATDAPTVTEGPVRFQVLLKVIGSP